MRKCEKCLKIKKRSQNPGPIKKCPEKWLKLRKWWKKRLNSEKFVKFEKLAENLVKFKKMKTKHIRFKIMSRKTSVIIEKKNKKFQKCKDFTNI